MALSLSALGAAVSTLNGFRLTTETGVPISTSDHTSQSTIYLTPFIHGTVAFYNGTVWEPIVSDEVSLDLTTGAHAPLTSGKNYDVFAYNNAGTLTLELSAFWTSNTARDDAITRQSGVWVKTSDTTRRLVGTIRSTSTTATEDSESKRFVWNANNQVPRHCAGPVETTDSWVYGTGTWRQARATSTNRFEFVDGSPDGNVLVEAFVTCLFTSTSGVNVSVGVGIDVTNANSAQIHGSNPQAGIGAGQITAHYKGYPGIGYHAVNWLEIGWLDVGTQTWYGDIGAPGWLQSGLIGTVML